MANSINIKNPETGGMTEVKVGDYICFKADIEESGKITKIDGPWITIEVEDQEAWDDVKIYTEHKSRCWV